MQLTINSSTSIRPLGEEHLRMFMRSTGKVVVNGAGVIVTETATTASKLCVSAERVRVREAEAMKYAESKGCRLATLKDVMLNRPFLRFLRDSFIPPGIWMGRPNKCFTISGSGIERTGSYRIDLVSERLEWVSEGQIKHDPALMGVLYVESEGVVRAARDGRLQVLILEPTGYLSLHNLAIGKNLLMVKLKR